MKSKCLTAYLLSAGILFSFYLLKVGFGSSDLLTARPLDYLFIFLIYLLPSLFYSSFALALALLLLAGYQRIVQSYSISDIVQKNIIPLLVFKALFIGFFFIFEKFRYSLNSFSYIFVCFLFSVLWVCFIWKKHPPALTRQKILVLSLFTPSVAMSVWLLAVLFILLAAGSIMLVLQIREIFN